MNFFGLDTFLLLWGRAGLSGFGGTSERGGPQKCPGLPGSLLSPEEKPRVSLPSLPTQG